MSSQKEVIIVRHGNWQPPEDQLTPQAKQDCLRAKTRLGLFALVISSPFERTRQTAQLLSGISPAADERASILASPPELSRRVAERRKTDPFGVAGAIISIKVS